MIQLRPGQAKTLRLTQFQGKAGASPRVNCTGCSMAVFGTIAGPPPLPVISFTPVNLVQGEFDMRIAMPAGAKRGAIHSFAVQTNFPVGDPDVPNTDISIEVIG